MKPNKEEMNKNIQCAVDHQGRPCPGYPVAASEGLPPDLVLDLHKAMTEPPPSEAEKVEKIELGGALLRLDPPQEKVETANEGLQGEELIKAIEKHEPQPQEDWRVRFRNKFGFYEIYICSDCGHTKEDHYWNGGGMSERSGYDRCRREDYKCVSENWKIKSVIQENIELESFITKEIDAARYCKKLLPKSEGDYDAICGVKLDCHLHDWRQKEAVIAERARIVGVISEVMKTWSIEKGGFGLLEQELLSLISKE